MTDTPSTPNLLERAISLLVDDTTPYRTHNAISIYASVVLGLCTLIITIACIHSDKNLSAELFTLVAALSGLAGYQFAKGVSLPSVSPLNPSINTSDPIKTADKKAEESKEGEG